MYEKAFSPLEPLDEIGEAPPLPDAETMLLLLDSDDTPQRMQAARAFCDIEEPKAIDRLIELLSDECALVRVSAAYALGRNSAPRAVQPLIHVLNYDWNGYVRKGAVWALGNAKDSRALPILIDVLKQDITAVRLWAASALGQLPLQSAIVPLLESLNNDPIAAVRSNCAWSLGRVLGMLGLASGDDGERTLHRQAISALVSALRDADSSVRDDAQIALQRLGDPDGLEALAELEDDFLADYDIDA
ncbi:MAG: HEAT repeat domain-containing protein [Synechococcus sp.]